LRQLRSAAHLTQEELADRAGLSARGIQDLERGVHDTPHPATVRRLADALGLSDAERSNLLSAADRNVPSDGFGLAPQPVASPPIPLTSFVGRQAEVSEIQQLLAHARLITLTGAGGVGKTRLAVRLADLEVAGRPDEALFVDLAPVTQPPMVLNTVASALAVRAEPGQPLQQTLVSALHPRRLPLVLDICEHVLAACADVGAVLLRHCPSLRVLATSRESLGIPGERVITVPPLAVPHSSADLTMEQLGQVESVQ